jgi:hypothetical protein
MGMDLWSFIKVHPEYVVFIAANAILVVKVIQWAIKQNNNDNDDDDHGSGPGDDDDGLPDLDLPPGVSLPDSNKELVSH